MKAINIKWRINFDEIIEVLDEMTAERAADTLEVPLATYAGMTTEERHDYAYSVFHHCPARAEEFLGLPNEVAIPSEITDEEDISDWLSYEYGYCHEGFSIEKFEVAIAVHGTLAEDGSAGVVEWNGLTADGSLKDGRAYFVVVADTAEQAYRIGLDLWDCADKEDLSV